VREPREAVDAHVADSLSALEVAELARATGIADVGAGAGFPGLPLAIAMPRARVDLIEATQRKCEVIERLAAAAGARNAQAIHRRAEEWGAGEGREAYGAITARAVDRLAVLLEYASPLLLEGGVLVAWKGKRDEVEERGAAAAAAKLAMRGIDVRRVIPFEGAEHRHLHVYEKTGATPPGIPRRAGMARKRPMA
jgi:16S rRNA (guanine527-N7)-methyltransferase